MQPADSVSLLSLDKKREGPLRKARAFFNGHLYATRCAYCSGLWSNLFLHSSEQKVNVLPLYSDRAGAFFSSTFIPHTGSMFMRSTSRKNLPCWKEFSARRSQLPLG